jgi:hypothetical protein
VLAGESQAGLWAGLGEQAGLGLDQDAAADQAFELRPDALGVLRRDRQVQGGAQVAGPERAAQLGEGAEDLPAGRVPGQVRGRRFRCRRLVTLAGEGYQRTFRGLMPVWSPGLG